MHPNQTPHQVPCQPEGARAQDPELTDDELDDVAGGAGRAAMRGTFSLD